MKYLAFLFLPLMALGCISKERYSIESIRAETNYGAKSIASQSDFGQEYPSKPISVIEAIVIALKNNPNIAIAASRIRQAEAKIDQANSAFLPILSLDTEYLRGDAPSVDFGKKLDQRKFHLGVDPKNPNSFSTIEQKFNHPGTFDNFESGLTMKYNLYHGGHDALRRQIAKTNFSIQKLDKESVENELIHAVIDAYYDALAAAEFIETAEKSVKTVEAQLQETRVKFNAGGALKSDLLSLEVRLAGAKENLIRARNSKELTLATLANLLGLNANASIALSGEEWKPREIPQDYDAGIGEALARRPELEKARQQLRSAKMNVDLEKSGYYPSVDLFGRYYYDDENFSYSGDDQNWYFGVAASWDVFDGFRTKSRVEEAKAIFQEMLAADRKATQAVQLDVKSSYLRLEEARARVAVTKASVAQAEETLELVKKQFSGGSVTVTRYLDAELALSTARVRAIAAKYDEKKAIANVGRALGFCGECAREVINNEDQLKEVQP